MPQRLDEMAKTDLIVQKLCLDALLEQLQASSAAELDPALVGAVHCPSCGSLEGQWRGYRHRKRKPVVHRRRCNNCGLWSFLNRNIFKLRESPLWRKDRPGTMEFNGPIPHSPYRGEQPCIENRCLLGPDGYYTACRGRTASPDRDIAEDRTPMTSSRYYTKGSYLENSREGKPRDPLDAFFGRRRHFLAKTAEEILELIQERVQLKYENIRRMDYDSCRIGTRLLQMEPWPLGSNPNIDRMRSGLEQELLAFEKEKRMEEVACWRDVCRTCSELREAVRELFDEDQRQRLVGGEL